MIQGQGQNLVGREPGAVLVNNPKAVRIAVQPKAKGGFASLDDGLYLRYGRVSSLFFKTKSSQDELIQQLETLCGRSFSTGGEARAEQSNAGKVPEGESSG